LAQRAREKEVVVVNVSCQALDYLERQAWATMIKKGGYLQEAFVPRTIILDYWIRC
jgi:hypothetical protein